MPRRTRRTTTVTRVERSPSDEMTDKRNNFRICFIDSQKLLQITRETLRSKCGPQKALSCRWDREKSHSAICCSNTNDYHLSNLLMRRRRQTLGGHIQQVVTYFTRERDDKIVDLCSMLDRDVFVSTLFSPHAIVIVISSIVVCNLNYYILYAIYYCYFCMSSTSFCVHTHFGRTHSRTHTKIHINLVSAFCHNRCHCMLLCVNGITNFFYSSDHSFIWYTIVHSPLSIHRTNKSVTDQR